MGIAAVVLYGKCVVKQECGNLFGGGNTGGDTGGDTGGVIDPPSGGTCPSGFKKNAQGKCYCNSTTKSCPSGQTAVVSGNSCVCKSKCTGTCPSGSKRNAQCNCICQNSCPAGTQRASGRCDCVSPQGSSGNCGWVGNQYTWRGKSCQAANAFVTSTVTNTSGNRTTGCNAAKSAWCNEHAPNPSGCKTGNGLGCCAPAAAYNVYGGTCGVDGQCTTQFRVNFGGLKMTPPFKCSGTASYCCKIAHDAWVRQYGSGYTQSFATEETREYPVRQVYNRPSYPTRQSRPMIPRRIMVA